MKPQHKLSPAAQALHRVFVRFGHEHAFTQLSARLSAPVPRLLKLKSSGRGRRCFIIGNGPSLNQMDLSLLRNEVTFGVNAIYLNHEAMGFLPTYYVVEDNFVAEDRADEINRMHGPTKIFPAALSDVLKPDEKTIYANVIYDYSEYPGFPHFSVDAARNLWVGGTVTYLNLQLAYYFGHDPIYLIGIDHNYVIPTTAKVKGTEIESTDDDPNHFNAGYFGKGYRWHDPKPERMEKSYRRARQVYEEYSRKVYNATVGGRLEVFERADYNSLF